MEQFTNTLLGGTHPGVFLALLLLAMFGSLVRVAYRADKKRKRAVGTPFSFSWPYFLINNLQKLVICFFGNFVGILLLNVTAGSTTTAVSSAATAIAAFGVGFVGGQFSVFLSNKSKSVKQ